MNYFIKSSVFLLSTILLTIGFFYHIELFKEFITKNDNPYTLENKRSVSSIKLPTLKKLNLLTIDYYLKFIKKNINCINSKCESVLTSQEVKSLVSQIYDYSLINDYQNKRISEISYDIIRMEEKKLKELGFLLLTTQDPSDRNLKFLINDIFSLQDTLFMGLTIIEFYRYQAENHKKMISDAFIKKIQNKSISQNDIIFKYAQIFIKNKTKVKTLQH